MKKKEGNQLISFNSPKSIYCFLFNENNLESDLYFMFATLMERGLADMYSTPVDEMLFFQDENSKYDQLFTNKLNKKKRRKKSKRKKSSSNVPNTTLQKSLKDLS